MLKGILSDREFASNDETGEGVALGWNDLTFNDVQSDFHK
jgi:hypothetical protein